MGTFYILVFLLSVETSSSRTITPNTEDEATLMAAINKLASKVDHIQHTMDKRFNEIELMFKDIGHVKPSVDGQKGESLADNENVAKKASGTKDRSTLRHVNKIPVGNLDTKKGASGKTSMRKEEDAYIERFRKHFEKMDLKKLEQRLKQCAKYIQSKEKSKGTKKGRRFMNMMEEKKKLIEEEIEKRRELIKKEKTDTVKAETKKGSGKTEIKKMENMKPKKETDKNNKKKNTDLEKKPNKMQKKEKRGNLTEKIQQKGEKDEKKVNNSTDEGNTKKEARILTKGKDRKSKKGRLHLFSTDMIEKRLKTMDVNQLQMKLKHCQQKINTFKGWVGKGGQKYSTLLTEMSELKIMIETELSKRASLKPDDENGIDGARKNTPDKAPAWRASMIKKKGMGDNSIDGEKEKRKEKKI